VKTVKSKIVFAMASLLVAVACESVQQPAKNRVINRPTGSLGKAVNTAGDEFAAGYESAAKDSFLMFTSNVNGRESVYRVPLPKVASDDSVRSISAPLHEMSSALARNTGTVASNGHTTVFAVSAAVQKELARILKTSGAVLGGSDIFERTATETRNVEELNSAAWDAHPTLSLLKNVEILVFSSDRMSNDGFSAPYDGVEHIRADGSRVRGNADLWYSFRIVGEQRWSAPRNFRSLQTTDSVNTPSNEYSPFIYCVDGTPHLLFASNRSGTYDIYDASLRIDAATKTMAIQSVQALPSGTDAVNTEAREVFPFIPFPHRATSEQQLIFSSDRFALRSPLDAAEVGAGGLDLYRMRTQMLCDIPDTTPKPKVIPKGNLRYVVTLVDGRTGLPTVRQGRITASVDTRSGTITRQTDSAQLVIDLMANDTAVAGGNVRVVATGGSDYSKRPCTEREPIITSYARRRISDRIQQLQTLQRVVQYDTAIQDPPIPVKRAAQLFETLSKGAKYVASTKRKEYVDATADGRLRIGRDTVLTVDSLPPVRTVRKKRLEFYTDTTYHYDTTFLPASSFDVASVRTQASGLTVRWPQQDTVINDTIIVYPLYETAAPCMQVFATSDSVRNVPYFQTGFWEVNTSTGYKRHLERLRKGDLEDAGWIELNWRNQYWGSRTAGEVTDRLERRRLEYRRKAEIIDGNITTLVQRTSHMLQRFWREHGADTNAKLIVSMMAYSDLRPIKVGRFISDTGIRYIAASYDSTRESFGTPTNVFIRPGSSLVGVDNDTLSKLRAYFGYTAVHEILRTDSLYASLRSQGLVVLPTDAATPAEYQERLRSARVIVLAEGRKVDMTVNPSTRGYIGDEDDYYALDAVRRVDVHVRRIDLRAPAWIVPECCR
jgi:hypothetical protein